MGQHIAKVKRFARTPTAKIQNVEKVLETKTVSPRHPSTVKKYEDLIKNNPQFIEETKNRNQNLHSMLESVHVESTGAPPDQVLRTGKSAKKVNRIMPGKLTLEQVDELFINHKVDPDTWTIEKICEFYNIDEDVAKNLLTYFSSFRIYKLPDKESVLGE